MVAPTSACPVPRLLPGWLIGPRRVYMALVSGAALCLWAALELRQPLRPSEWAGVALWLGLGLFAQAGEFELPRVGGTSVWISTGFAVSAAAIATLPPAGAMFAVGLGSMTINQWRFLRRHPSIVLFNRGAIALCGAAAAGVYGIVSAHIPGDPVPSLIAGTLAASTFYFACNVGFVGTYAALKAGRSLRRPWLWPMAWSPSLMVTYLALGLFGDLAVAMWRLGGAGAMFLALLPLAVTCYSLRQHAQLLRYSQALAHQYEEAERARGQARAILDTTEEGMALLAADGRVLAVNRRFQELFATGADDLLGRHLDEVRGLLDRFFGDRVDSTGLAALLADRQRRVAGEVRQRWPEERDLQVVSSPVEAEGGAALGRLFAFRDVTQERAAERVKDQFISLVSHELRTPLTSIKGYVELLLDDEEGQLSAEQRDFLGIIKHNADREVALVNDLLDLSRLEEGKFRIALAPTALRPLLETAATSLRPAIEAKGQALLLDLPDGLPMLLGDAVRLGQVFTNLLSNAHKYTPAGGRITVRAACEAGAARVEVADTGVGLSTEEQARLFTKFFRAANAATRAVGGTGLGLTITRALVELHGGTIAVESAPGRGSTFRVTLPATPEAVPAPAR